MQRSRPKPAEAHNETRQHTTARITQYSRAKQSSVPQQQRRTATPPAASTNTSPTPNTQGAGQTHHTGTSPTHSHRRPQTRHTRGASPRAHDPTPQHQHGTHHTRNNQGHTYTQHRRDASLMHSPGAITIPTTPGGEGNPNLSKGVARAGGWQPATRLSIGQRPKTCIARE